MIDDIVINTHITIPSSEIEFRYSRSSGPGGQNVNKVSTKVELLFDLGGSGAIDEPAKHRLRAKLASHIDSAGLITVTSQESRSQFQNRRIAVEKFVLLLRKGLAVAKPRKDTKPTRTSKKKRLDSKTKRGVIKRSRTKHIDID